MSPQLLLAAPPTRRACLTLHSTSDHPTIGVAAENGWRVAFVRHRNVAERLLEYLKGRGIIIREVRALSPTAFVVRWRY